jgi:hypothetical protein
MARTHVKGNRAARLASARKDHARKARRAQWIARVLVVWALVAMAMFAVALTYRDPDPVARATMGAPRLAPAPHLASSARKLGAGVVGALSQGGALLASWLD